MFDERLVARLYGAARADRWRVDRTAFAQQLNAGAARAFAGQTPRAVDVERYASALHLQDLALACGCAAGDEEAWRHFVLVHRPILYRAADAIDPSGEGRELADSLYADLFGLGDRNGQRQSLFRYFHGRSSLATWLRAVLSQRHVDRLRQRRRMDPLPDDDSPQALPAAAQVPDPERARFVALMRGALTLAVGALPAADRLRFACYYAQQMTLAQIGRLLGEHEATASRHLARTRAAIRAAVEQRLKTVHHLGDAEIEECFRAISEDSGPLDLREWLVPADAARAGRLMVGDGAP